MALDAPRETDRLRVAGGPERDHLEALGKAVEAITDFGTRVVQAERSGPVFLHVVNPAAESLSEDITCRTERVSGDLWFWWSWDDTIAPAEDPAGAAQAIKRVLTPKP